MSKKCVNCGAELEDGAVFCDECGIQQTVLQTFGVNGVQSVQNNLQQNIVSQSASATQMKNSGMGIASFVLGIVSICTFGCLFVPEILGIIFGIMAICNKNVKHGLAIGGLVMSVIAALVVLLFLFI